MRKLLLLLAVSAIVVASCQKNSDNKGPYTCTCQYTRVTGTLSHDTTENTTYATNTTLTIAQQSCENNQTTLRAAGWSNANCYLK